VVDGVHLDDATAAGIATDLWRARRRAGAHPALARALDSLGERLTRAGVEVQDHDGLRVDAGTALDVVAWEPRPDVEPDVVVETVVPSVYVAGRLVQIGQVVLARPAGSGGEHAPDH
jgi:hypothetical protein